MLLQIPQLFSPEEARQLRETLERAQWRDGRQTAGHLAQSVKRNEQLALDDPIAIQLGEQILARLGQNPLFISAALPARVLPPRFNRYAGGGTYGNHIDNAIFTIPGNGARVRTDISSTLFLSDPDSYDGGELVIEDTYGVHSIKLPAGHMVVYPGTSLHRVNPVTRGVRYASFFWTQSLVALDVQRRTLFELDTAIQRLTADHPEHPSISQLTGVYHNLLRLWSTT
ncbi:Fe(II)-dependent oxygenase [Lampropedia cohaerens]|uniref:Fe(II)-dependent oxygenase n=1 Tax=Lampropedia cohaerens TaxID=1610491 RepID=A0A0U1Q3D8_9BURK|nr:Fe2+-dependent dioxygenase [Lampropedia cohaerens]KKW69254.1 Fe(II)-dependent oxygenase [Lampropedia cohaerens]